MTHTYQIADIIDFCFDASKIPIQHQLACDIISDSDLLNTVRYIMYLKLKLGGRPEVEFYLEKSKRESLAITLDRIRNIPMEESKAGCI